MQLIALLETSDVEIIGVYTKCIIKHYRYVCKQIYNGLIDAHVLLYRYVRTCELNLELYIYLLFVNQVLRGLTQRNSVASFANVTSNFSVNCRWVDSDSLCMETDIW